MRLALPILLALAAPAVAQTHVAPTDALAPADEQKTFQLPPGFEAQLVAAEPDIGKPIQIAFDAKGRLWATTSRHYPFPAEGEASDKLYVLSDFGPDGKAKKVTVFDDKLNIPVGVLPLPDGKSCLVSQVGSILKLTDTDGDGKADKRETLLTGFGTEDTHGMTNSFVLLPDGWVYATHGFKNTSVVKAKDGSEITMNSGNTYRFRPDGSRIEHWTYGQVNPFGMCVDPYFNLYTADCHSKPITQLIRGATYNSFFKPHDGLGFAPHVTRHDHKSTALCGLAWYDADHFPKEWRGCLFLGNVTGNRINADRIEWKGSTPVGKELPDFLVSSDPWFRPTDVKLGPDGALYVADFYNKIIGHYEVPLKHPGRDKDRGRLWRIVWKGQDGKAKPPEMPDLTTADEDERAQFLSSPNITTRLLATNDWIHRLKHGETVSALVILKDPPPDRQAVRFVHGGWVAVGAGKLKPGELPALLDKGLKDWAGKIGPGFLYTHLFRAAGSAESLTPELRKLAFRILGDADRHAARAAAEALIAHPHPDNIKPLIELLQICPTEDTHLRHAARVALRNALRDGNGWAEAEKAAKSPADAAVLADVALGAAGKEAAAFLAARFRQVDPARQVQVAEFIGRHGERPDRERVLHPSVGAYPDRVLGEARYCQALLRGMQAAGVKMSGVELDDALGLIRAAFAHKDAAPQTAAVGLLKLLIQIVPEKDYEPYRLGETFAGLGRWAANPDRPADVRLDAVEVLLKLNPPAARPALRAVVLDPRAPLPARERAVGLLTAAPTAVDEIVIKDAFKDAPYRLAVTLATGLAGTSFGADLLFASVKAGTAPARLLQEKAVVERLRATKVRDLNARLAELTRGFPPAEKRIDDLIRARAAGFGKTKPDLELGKKAFTQHCAACHQVGGEGQKIGPQLDGIGNRGAERLLEDVLDPNRNVDAAFRATVLNLADGRTLTGLLVREEGQVLVLADAAGKEVRVPQADVEKRTLSPLSPMPANFDTAVPEADFRHLLAYLLEQRAKDKPK
jgi:putative heme-binding domain-containing protein